MFMILKLTFQILLIRICIRMKVTNTGCSRGCVTMLFVEQKPVTIWLNSIQYVNVHSTVDDLSVLLAFVV